MTLPNAEIIRIIRYVLVVAAERHFGAITTCSTRVLRFRAANPMFVYDNTIYISRIDWIFYCFSGYLMSDTKSGDVIRRTHKTFVGKTVVFVYRIIVCKIPRADISFVIVYSHETMCRRNGNFTHSQVEMNKHHRNV